MKDRAKTPNVPGSDRVATTKNGRKMLKVKCVVCGIMKTHFLPGVGGKKSGAGIRDSDSFSIC